MEHIILENEKTLRKTFIDVRDFVSYRFKENPAKKRNYYIHSNKSNFIQNTANGQALMFAVSLEASAKQIIAKARSILNALEVTFSFQRIMDQTRICNAALKPQHL